MATPPTTRERLDRIFALYGEDLKRMTPKARAEQLEITWELFAGNDKPEALGRIESVDYEREPVSVEKFIYDRECLGQSLKDDIYPALVDDLVEIFEGDYSEVVLGGGIGWGKTRMMEVGLGYEIYQLSCLKDPAQHFGLIPGSTLAMVNVSVDSRQAFRVLFRGLYELIQRSPYFRTVFPYNRNRIRELRFLHKNITAYPTTASEEGVLGEGVFSAAFDEANFMEVVEKSKRSVPGDTGLYDQMQVVYNKLRDRITSRFLKRGKVPGHLWAGSSARFPNDFTERKEAEAKTNPRIFFRRRNIYGTKPRHFFLPETFKVEMGDVGRRSRVLDGSETDVTGRIETIPLDFKPSFLADTDRAVRDIAGYSVLSITPFILHREMIRAMFERGQQQQPPMQPTFTQLEVTLQNPLPEVERLLPENLHWIDRHKEDFMGRPLYHDAIPGARGKRPVTEKILFPGYYYAHVDLSKSGDATGLVVLHTVGGKQVPRLDLKTNATVYETLPILRVDLALRIVAPPNGEIDIPRVRALLYQLHRQLGIEFGLVTFDTFQSQESVKSLEDAGIRSDIYSVDRDFTPWEQLKSALYDGRLMCYEFPHLERELAQLERTPKKIDHPTGRGGSKDVADCLAAAVHHAEEGWRNSEGVRGMFQLGLVERPGQVPEPTPLQREASVKIATGEPLSDPELDVLIFPKLD